MTDMVTKYLVITKRKNGENVYFKGFDNRTAGDNSMWANDYRSARNYYKQRVNAARPVIETMVDDWTKLHANGSFKTGYKFEETLEVREFIINVEERPFPMDSGEIMDVRKKLALEKLNIADVRALDLGREVMPFKLSGESGGPKIKK